MPSRNFLSALFIAFALSGLLPRPASAADAETYALDPVHTRVLVTVSHSGFSKAMGTVSGSTGTLRFDPDDWRTAQLEVTVPIAQLDLGDAKWNKAVLAPNLLDGRRYPTARFVSTTIEPIAADKARGCGELTLRGVTRQLCMEVTLNALKRHPLPPFRRTAGFSATATLSRKTFGITAWPSVIGDEVVLSIEAEAVRGHAPASDPPEAPADQPPALDEPDTTDQPPQPAAPDRNPDCAPNARESDPPLPASTESNPTPSQP